MTTEYTNIHNKQTLWHVSILRHGKRTSIGRVECAYDEIKRAFPYSTITGDSVVVFAMGKHNDYV